MPTNIFQLAIDNRRVVPRLSFTDQDEQITLSIDLYDVDRKISKFNEALKMDIEMFRKE